MSRAARLAAALLVCAGGLVVCVALVPLTLVVELACAALALDDRDIRRGAP